MCAVSSAGSRLYSGTGSATAPFAPAVHTSVNSDASAPSGREHMNQTQTQTRTSGRRLAAALLTLSTVNTAGLTAGDLLTRDTSGVLWLHLGKGDGTFAPRVRVGGGWGVFSQLVGAGDLNNDGRADLIGYGSGGTWAYLGTGNTTAPFTRVATDLCAGEGTKFNSVS